MRDCHEQEMEQGRKGYNGRFKKRIKSGAGLRKEGSRRKKGFTEEELQEIEDKYGVCLMVMDLGTYEDMKNWSNDVTGLKKKRKGKSDVSAGAVINAREGKSDTNVGNAIEKAKKDAKKKEKLAYA